MFESLLYKKEVSSMKKLDLSKFEDDISQVKKYSDEIYDSLFEDKFSFARGLYRSLQDTNKPISDSDLEYILIEVPLLLFEVSESLNSLRLTYETIKLRSKKSKFEFDRLLKEDGFSSTERNQLCQQHVIDDNLILSIYSSIISRVESEISFSKELVMSAKKIWDRRKETETVHNTSVSDLPEYTGPNTYIG